MTMRPKDDPRAFGPLDHEDPDDAAGVAASLIAAVVLGVLCALLVLWAGAVVL